jgi:RNA polymerase sigma factor (sigma-70 family)
MSSIASSGMARQGASSRLVRSAPKESGGLSPARERELAARIAAGDASARDELILGNVKLAQFRAHRLFYSAPHCHTIDDLIQSGCEGLAVAADKYDPFTHGVRFSTYATWWVDQKIRRAIQDTGELVRLPAHIHDRRQAAERRESFHRIQRDSIDVAVNGDDHLARLVDDEQRTRLRHAIARLKPHQRELLWWFATDYNTPGPKPEPNNVRRNRAHAAKKLISKLRQELNQEGTDHV